jgi:hypothetical protein
MSLLRDDLSSNEWLLMLIDLMHFRQVFDDIASNFFRHFSYEPSETAVLSEVESPGLLWLLFSHHHTSKGIIAACLINMIVFIVCFSQQFVIDTDGFSILAHVEVAISKPKTIFDLNVDVSLTFQ